MVGLTYEERQDHPRRCTARRHDGEPCGKFATVGASVCYAHGGWAPHIRRAGLLRRMAELNAQAQYEAALNVMLPPELHKLVGGGGRGNKKAAPETAPEPTPPAPPPALAGIATGPRRPAGQPAIIDADEPAREGPGKAPASTRGERNPAAGGDGPRHRIRIG